MSPDRQLLSQTFCLIVFGSFLALRLSFLPAPSISRNVQTPKQALVVLKSGRKENERRKKSCKQNLVGILRVGFGVERR